MTAMQRPTRREAGRRVRRRGGVGIVAALVLVTICLGISNSAHGDQGGASFWTSGQYASQAATPLNPGWTLQSSVNTSYGTASTDRRFSIGNTLVGGVTSQGPTFTLTPTYTLASPVLGASLSLALSFGGGYNHVSVEATIFPSRRNVRAEQSLWGFSDLQPLVTLTWTKGNNNWMTYLTGNIPVGSYSSSNLAAIGIGHGAVDAGGGYTYLNAKSGWEFSIVGGLTGNAENQSTQYRNGVDSHLDYATSYAITPNVQIGVAGYLYYQLTGDSGSGAKLGPFLSKVSGVGPEIGWNFNVGRQQWSANLRGYYEYWSQNRVRGTTGFFTLSIPLSPPPKSGK
jgi:hypothetical protein